MSANRLRTQLHRYHRERIRSGVLGVVHWSTSPARMVRLASFALLVITGGCAKNVATEEPAVPNLPARRASASFIHCVEQTGAQCVSMHQKFGGWDAFSVLGWLAHGSPVSILQAFRSELEHHRDLQAIQGRMVNLVNRLHTPLRGAACEVSSSLDLGPMVPKLVTQVKKRLAYLGLWHDELQEVVDGLAKEASSDLAEGTLVGMTCSSDPYQVYIAATKDTNDGRQVIVGLMTGLPRSLGGKELERSVVEGKIRGTTLNSGSPVSQAEGRVHPWIDIPVEEF